MKLDFRIIENEIDRFFHDANVSPENSHGHIYIGAVRLRHTGGNENIKFTFSDSQNVIDLTSLAEHLTDFINQRGDKP